MFVDQALLRLRAVALSLALFAITFAVLQPLAHAALMRTGGLEAVAALWGPLCQPEKGEAGDQKSGATKVHDCCFGLAHSPVLGPSSIAFIPVEPGEPAARVVAAHHHLSTGAIRDGPHQPRAPPLPKA